MATKARGQDVTGIYQDPRKMRYGEWAGLGFCYGFYEVAIGTRRMPWVSEHRAGMRAAAYLTAPYLALHEDDDPVEQAKILIGERGPDDEIPNMFDYERRRLTERMLRTFCDYYDEHTDVEMLNYTGKPKWTQSIPPAGLARYKKYELLIAAYPFDSPPQPDGRDIQPMDPVSVALRSTPPPANRQPDLMAPYFEYWAHQHTGHGSLVGYPGFLDLQVHRLTEAELRARYPGGRVAPPVVVPPPSAEPGWTPAELATIAGVAREVRAAAERLAELGN